MSKLSSQILAFLVLFLALPAHAQDERTVTLITIGPGDQIWEKFGHNMIWLRDPARNVDLCYNWGLFDFDQPGFIRNFVQGRMTYWMDAFPPDQALAVYYHQRRQVTFQRLKLADAQFDELLARCEVNRMPGNQFYKYDYFRDNCSTRVRDMLDLATGGEVKRLLAAHAPAVPMSYRQHAMRLMQDDLILSLGVDFTIGPFCDRPLDAWDEGFLPTRLAGAIEPLVSDARSPWPSPRGPEYENVPDRRLPFVVAGVLGGALIGSLTMSRLKWFRRTASALSAAWLALGAVGASFMLYVWCFTDHVSGYANQNLLPFSPAALAILIAWWAARRVAESPIASGPAEMGVAGVAAAGRTRRTVVVLVAIPVVLSLVALVGNLAGLFSQRNLHFILLTIPLHLAAGLTVLRSIGLIQRP